MKKEYNKAQERYLKMIRDGVWFEDITDIMMYPSNYSDDELKEDFIKYAHHKINYIVHGVRNELFSKFRNNENNINVFCSYFQKVLYNNLFTDSDDWINLYTTIFQNPEIADDTGCVITPKVHFDNPSYMAGECEYKNMFITLHSMYLQEDPSCYTLFIFEVEPFNADGFAFINFENYIKEDNFLIDSDYEEHIEFKLSVIEYNDNNDTSRYIEFKNKTNINNMVNKLLDDIKCFD